MKNIAIYGGAFDPIHNGHVAIIQELKNNKEMDEVWIMPTRVSRWKNDAAPSSLRLKCLEKVIEGLDNVHIRKDEIESQKEVIYTIDTIRELHQKYNDVNFYFVIGYDQLSKLDKWRDIEELSKLVKFLIVGRPNNSFHQENYIKYNCELLNFDGPDISSTKFKETLDLSLVPQCIHNLLWEEPYYYEIKLKTLMCEKRFLHSKSVMELAKKIALANNLELGVSTIAALLHDCAKEAPREEEDEIMNKYFIKYLDAPDVIKHQFTGSILVERLFGIKDSRVKQAILYHTTGYKEMSWLDKLVYACDKLDPLRGYDSSFMINECMKDLDKGFITVLKENMKYLGKKSAFNDYYLTLEAVKFYLEGED